MGKKNTNWELYSLIKKCFSKCFICNVGSESGSLLSDCKDKQHLSSSTESLTPQKVEGQRETLLSVCTPSWSQGCTFGFDLVCLLDPFTCLSSCPLTALPVLAAVKNFSNCKKKMVCVCLGHWPSLF